MSDVTCSVEGCDNPHQAKGLCKSCYRRDYYQRNKAHELASNLRWVGERPYYRRDQTRRLNADAISERARSLAERLASDSKPCTKCFATKLKSEFYGDSSHLDGLYSWCKECFNAHMRATYDPDATAARQLQYMAKPGNRAKAAARVRKWRENNPERWAAWYEADAPKARDRARAWAKANPEQASINSRRGANLRRARERDQSAGPVDLPAILAEHGMFCHICQTPIDSLDDLHFDHVIPLSKGGPHSAENILPAHRLCNLRKGARLIT